jgi:hypothetical protein
MGQREYQRLTEMADKNVLDLISDPLTALNSMA